MCQENGPHEVPKNVVIFSVFFLAWGGPFSWNSKSRKLPIGVKLVEFFNVHVSM